jgi:hypothetical protein
MADQLTRFAIGDDFTNVGASAISLVRAGEIFKATGTTPATWSNGSVLNEIAIADLTRDADTVFEAATQTALKTSQRRCPSALTRLGSCGRASALVGRAGKFSSRTSRVFHAFASSQNLISSGNFDQGDCSSARCLKDLARAAGELRVINFRADLHKSKGK